MRIAWGLVAIAMLGCGEKKKQEDYTPIVREVDLDEVKPAEPPPEPAAVVDSQPAQPDPPPVQDCVAQGTVVSWDAAKLRACFDLNDDGSPEHCVTWRRDGKVASIDTEFAVEDADAKEPPEPPIEYRTDTVNNDDGRIMAGETRVEVCPYDHACMRFMARADDEVVSVLTDRDYRRGVFLMKAGAFKGAVEIWDFSANRLRSRTPLKRLVEDETYDFSAKLGSGVVIALAENSAGRTLGAIFSLEGGLRGELAQGSRTLDGQKTFHHGGVFGIVDIGPEDSDKPYVLHLVSLANGSALGKIAIKREANAELSLDTLPNNFVGITQFGEQLRLDILDLRTRTSKVFFAPGC
jgi:hypothetical protein